MSTKGHTFLARYTESGGYTEDFIKMNTVLTPKKNETFFLKKMLTSFSLLFWLAVYFLADKKHRELLQTLKSRQEELWTYEIGQPLQSSPAVSAGRIVIGSNDGGVYCFGAK